MENAFTSTVGIATITGAVSSVLAVYAMYAAELGWWPFASKYNEEKKRMARLEDVSIGMRECQVQLVDVTTSILERLPPRASTYYTDASTQTISENIG